MPDQPNPRQTSAAYGAMAPFWAKVSAVLAGVDALREVSATSVAGPHLPAGNLRDLNRGGGGPQSPFLPKFPNESAEDYEIRRRNAPLTNIYGDISNNLSSKPFSRLCELDEEAAADLKKLQQDIDGQGNNLHVFASATFKEGLDKAITWVLVDYTKVPPGVTLADERKLGARPYWVAISPEKLLAVYSKFVGGKEVIHHARIYEPCVESVSYGEIRYERVRVFNREPVLDALNQIASFMPATWELWEEQEMDPAAGSAAAAAAGAGGTASKEKTWVRVGNGPVSIGVIPLVPIRTGRRDGMTWCVHPPLRDLVNMQIEEFQQESSLKSIKELTAFPMLAGNGISNTNSKGEVIRVPVGPRTVLFAPMSESGSHGEWTYVEPAAASLTFLSGDLEKMRTEMRDLGMQPLTSANLTVITTANVAMKAHNAVQAWALALKDALEQCFKITCMWLGRSEEPTVKVHTDFSVEIEDKSAEHLLTAEGQGIFSKQTIREEFKRRGMLSDDYVEEDEDQRLAEQNAGLEPEQPLDPRTGLPLVPPGNKLSKPTVTVQ